MLIETPAKTEVISILSVGLPEEDVVARLVAEIDAAVGDVTHATRFWLGLGMACSSLEMLSEAGYSADEIGDALRSIFVSYLARKP